LILPQDCADWVVAKNKKARVLGPRLMKVSIYIQDSKLERQVRHENEIYISMRMIDMQGNGRF
jgi:hypothetical protein